MENFKFSMQDHLMALNSKCEEDCIIKVLTDFLGREPIIDDFKRVSRIYKDGIYNKYVIGYDYKNLGTIQYFYEGNIFKVEFTPFIYDSPHDLIHYDEAGQFPSPSKEKLTELPCEPLIIEMKKEHLIELYDFAYEQAVKTNTVEQLLKIDLKINGG